MLERFEITTFEPLAGHRFELADAGGAGTEPDRVELELVEVQRVGEVTARQARELGKRLPFSLVFRGPAELAMEQGIQRLRHPELGELELFLVPIDRREDGTLFEAVFT